VVGELLPLLDICAYSIVGIGDEPDVLFKKGRPQSSCMEIRKLDTQACLPLITKSNCRGLWTFVATEQYRGEWREITRIARRGAGVSAERAHNIRLGYCSPAEN